MLSTAEGILLFISTSEAVLGILGDTVIGFVNCNDFIKNKKLSKIGLIISGLVISRIFLAWLLITDAYTKLFSGQLISVFNITEYMNYLWIIANNLSVWFATSLSVFYFLKIANFSHHMFLWLKKRIKVVFIFLTGCLLVTWLLSFPLVGKLIQENKRNTSQQFPIKKSEFIVEYVFVNVGVIFCFMVALTACFLLIISLWRHRRRMKSHVLGFRDLNTEAHVKAMKVLISFIILYMLYFIGIAIYIFCLFIPENKLLFLFGLTIACMCPCCHSLILILTNSQLKQYSVGLLQRLRCGEKGTDLRAT
ncbi:taste receptor type 2 member 114-like [Cricetulus griseus]|uniref:Taste receptor type 2 n=1 Tax=Cricetulus griseus TaxID=10029 RepID=A0A9J7GJ61_CRIGR|nr:taste receptor type 2 member 114-like [Cricetulus griseus]XP_027285811.1 taste receptor type 2 member 114-like [Cricetulus griseus]